MHKSRDIFKRRRAYYFQKKSFVQHKRLYKELVSRKLMNPRCKHVCSACLDFEDYRQSDVSI